MRQAEVNRLARLLMQAWEEEEGMPVTPSYVATFVAMAERLVEEQALTLAAAVKTALEPEQVVWSEK